MPIEFGQMGTHQRPAPWGPAATITSANVDAGIRTQEIDEDVPGNDVAGDDVGEVVPSEDIHGQNGTGEVVAGNHETTQHTADRNASSQNGIATFKEPGAEALGASAASKYDRSSEYPKYMEQ